MINMQLGGSPLWNGKKLHISVLVCLITLFEGSHYLLNQLIVDSSAELVEELHRMTRGGVVWNLLARRVAWLRKLHLRIARRCLALKSHRIG